MALLLVKTTSYVITPWTMTTQICLTGARYPILLQILWKSRDSYCLWVWILLSNNNSYLFQWCPEGRVSLWYVIYRVCMALLFVGCVAGHAITGGNGVKWLTYMTDLGVMFLTLHYVIDATLSVCRWTWEHYNPNDTCKESCSSIWFISLDAPLVHIHNWTFSRSSRTKT